LTATQSKSAAITTFTLRQLGSGLNRNHDQRPAVLASSGTIVVCAVLVTSAASLRIQKHKRAGTGFHPEKLDRKGGWKINFLSRDESDDTRVFILF
jgi:hypothetical protein